MNARASLLDRLPPVGPASAVLVPMLVAFALRMLYVLTFQQSPAFAIPIMDEAIHDGWARGGMQFMYDGVPYFRAPLYMWFLQAIYALDDGYLLVRIVQAALSALTVGLVADLGRRVAGPFAGLVGGLLLAFCWPVIYFAGELVIVTLFSFLAMAALWCFVVASSRRRLGWAIAGAAVLGISSIARPTSLVFLPAIAWLCLRTWRDWLNGARTRVLACTALLLIALLPGLALTVRNQVVGSDPVFIASQGGVNFYIGNNPQSDGRTAVVPGTSATWAGGYAQSIARAEAAVGRELRPSEVSAWYGRQGLRFLAEEPAAAASLYARKVRLLLGAAEQSNNKNPHFWRSRNPVLRLPIFSSWALIFALGAVGMVLARRRVEAVPLNLFVILYAAGLLAFFINERFRTPETIALACFAGVPVAAVVELWRKERSRALTIAAAALLLLTLSSLDRIGFHGDDVESDAFSQTTLGNLYLQSGEPGRAADTYLGALEAARRYRLAGFEEVERIARANLVTALLQSGREEEAAQQVDFFSGAFPDDWRAPLVQGRLEAFRYRHRAAGLHFEEAFRRNPSSAEAMAGLARAKIESQEWEAARTLLRQAATVDDSSAQVWATYALFELEGRDSRGRARRYARRALEIDPGEPTAHYVLGRMYGLDGRPEAMLYHYREALFRDPYNIPITRTVRRGGKLVEDLLRETGLRPPDPSH